MPQLMVKGTNTQFALHSFEGGLDLRQLYVALPQYRRILPHQLGAQQIVTILQLSRFQLGLGNSDVKAVPRYRFAFARNLDLEKTINTSGFCPRRTHTPQQLVPARTTSLHGPQPTQRLR